MATLNFAASIRKGTLTNLGYSSKKSKISRHRALNKAIKRYGKLSVFRKLVVVSTLQKRTNPVISKRLRRDAKWVMENH